MIIFPLCSVESSLRADFPIPCSQLLLNAFSCSHLSVWKQILFKSTAVDKYLTFCFIVPWQSYLVLKIILFLSLMVQSWIILLEAFCKSIITNIFQMCSF